MRRLSRFFISAALAGLMVIAIPMAVLALQINIFVADDPAYGVPGGITVVDGSPGDGYPLVTGVVQFQSGSYGTPAITGLSINSEIGSSNSPGFPPSSFLDLSWNVQSIGNDPGVTLRITALDIGFTFPPSGTTTSLLSRIDGNLTGTGSVSYQQFILDAQGNIVVFTPLQGPYTATNGNISFGPPASVAFTSNTPFAIQDVLNITVGPSTITTGDGISTTGVPEPMSVILLGSGLVGFGLYRRLRKPKG